MDRTMEWLSSYACGLAYEDLSPEVVHKVKRTLVDTMGCAMGAFLSEPAKIGRHLAANVTSRVPSRILGTKDHSSPDMAGFANGVMVRYLDFNDVRSRAGYNHPSDMIPAVLALADPLRSDGRTVITSILVAFETACRLGEQVRGAERDLDVGTFCVVGAACGAGRVMGLSQEQMGHAISLAVVPNMPLGVRTVGELSMWKGCASANSVRAGIFAAQLAQQGMTGPFEPFDGRRGLYERTGRSVQLENTFGGRGKPFAIDDTNFKHSPSNGATQSPITLAYELRSKVATEEIEAIRIRTYGSAMRSSVTDPEKWDPKTRETADHSIPYVVAVAFQDGVVNLDSFRPQRVRDPALRPLINRMTIEEDPIFTQHFPAENNCWMEVTTRAGQKLVAETSYAKGHYRNPFSDSEVEAKFRHTSEEVLTEQQCDRVLKLIWSLEDLPNLEQLFDALVV
jgi:2-methylcitrate dehydratase